MDVADGVEDVWNQVGDGGRGGGGQVGRQQRDDSLAVFQGTIDGDRDDEAGHVQASVCV